MSSKVEKYGVGVLVAVITPATSDGQVDEKSLERIITHDITGGVHGIFVLGTTGEDPSFTLHQKEKVIRIAKRLAGERLPLYVGVMDSSTERVKENIRCAEDNGADIAVVTPHYYLSSKNQDEIIRHMEECARYASIPIFAYNIPQSTHVNISLESVEKIIQINNVIGLKDSSGDWEQFQKEIFLKEKKHFKLLIGAEELFGMALVMGADGCVTGIGNYAPELIVQMYKKAKEGDVRAVKELQHKVSGLRRMSFAGDFWLAGLKYACSIMGLCEEYVSLPLQPLSDVQKAKVRNILVEQGLLS